MLVVLEDFLQFGMDQIVVGYVFYGFFIMLVYIIGCGVNGFMFDFFIGEFCFFYVDMKMLEIGCIYVMNEGNIYECLQGVCDYIFFCQQVQFDSKLYFGCYIGLLVVDFYCNLIKGGIYIYFVINQLLKGKFCFMYECNLFVFIVEQVGGMVISGVQCMFDIKLESLYQCCGFFIGFKKMMEKVVECFEVVSCEV